MLRAFEGTDPEKVRTIILGQDPYSNPAWVTGRAFEQGDLLKWPDQPRAVADSLRRIVQAIMVARTGAQSYTAGDRAWSQLAKDAHSGLLHLEPPRRLFDRLEREGVLFLNTSLTNQRSRAGRRAERMPPPLPALGAVSSPAARVPRGQAIGSILSSFCWGGTPATLSSGPGPGSRRIGPGLGGGE